MLMYAALFTRVRSAFKKIHSGFNEWFTLCSSLLTLLVFSFSGFQLPHYTNIIFPMLAVLCAAFIGKLVAENNRVWARIQTILAILLLVMGAALVLLYRPRITVLFIAVILGLIIVLFLLHRRYTGNKEALPYLRSGIAMLFLALVLNLSFYPDLLRYQSGNQAAAFMNREYPGQELGRLGFYFPSGEFYMHAPVYGTTVENLAMTGKGYTGGRLLFITAYELPYLQKQFPALQVVREFEEFHVTTLSLKFILPQSRQKELKKQFLVRLP